MQPTQTPLSLLWGTRIAKSGADPIITLTVDLETSTPLYKRLRAGCLHAPAGALGRRHSQHPHTGLPGLGGVSQGRCDKVIHKQITILRDKGRGKEIQKIYCKER